MPLCASACLPVVNGSLACFLFVLFCVIFFKWADTGGDDDDDDSHDGAEKDGSADKPAAVTSTSPQAKAEGASTPQA